MNKHALGLVLAFGLSAMATAATAAEVALPKELPAFAADKPLPKLDLRKHKLDNGLEVWILPRNGLPRVDAQLVLRGAGHSADATGSEGFSSLLATLLDEGTQRRDSRAIAEAAQALGGSIGASANVDGLRVFASSLASKSTDMLALLAEVARTPVFPDREVALAKANALQKLKANEAEPGYLASRALDKAIHGSHAYANSYPSEDSINAVAPERLRAAHAARFRPDHALLIVTGRLDEAQALGAVQTAFGDWANLGQPLASAPRQESADWKPSHLLLPREGSVQSAIRIGRPAAAATHPDYFPLQLAAHLLGSGMNARLFRNLREEKGYTYGAYASYAAYLLGGEINSEADVRNEVTGAALKEFGVEFARLGSELPPAQELLETKRNAIGIYTLRNQLQSSVAASLANYWLVGLSPDVFSAYPEKINAVTPQQVRDVGRRYFALDKQAVVVVGDEAQVAGQLEAYGDFERP